MSSDPSSLAYEVHRIVDGEPVIAGDERADAWERMKLITDHSGIDALRDEWMTADDRAFIENTDFDTSVLLVVAVTTSEDSTGIELTGVKRDDDRTIHSYSRVGNPSRLDDAFLRTFIVRVSLKDGPPPTRALHTHRGGNTDLDLTATPV